MTRTWGWFTVGHRPGLWLVTVRGYGLHAKDTRRQRLYFSERHGLSKALMLGPWRVTTVRPWRGKP